MNSSVPEGWSLLSFGDVLDDIRNGFSGTQNLSKEGVPVSRIETIAAGVIDFTKIGFVQTNEDIERYKLCKHDILFSHINSLSHIAKSAIYKGEQPLYLGMNLLRLRVDASRISPIYFHQLLCFEKIRDYFRASAKSAINQASLNLQDIKAASFVFPSLLEQQKIASILTAVDEVIESTKAQINKLKDLKTGMMQELLTKGIGHTEFKDSPVGPIPKAWEVQNLSEILERVVDCEHKTAPYVENSSYLVVRTNNVKNGQLILADMKFTTQEAFDEWTSRAVPSDGDILFTREAPAGESCLVPPNMKICMGQRMVLLRTNRSIVDARFLSIYLNSQAGIDAIFQRVIGTTVSRINIEDIKKIPCVIPELDEQQKISNLIASVQTKQNVLALKLAEMKIVKKGLMQDLLTGKVRVASHST